MKFINLKLFRREIGITQKELVTRIGLPQSVVSYLENGVMDLKEKHLMALNQAFPYQDFSQYIYESETYPQAIQFWETQPLKDTDPYPGMWTVPTPLEYVESLPILCKNGRVRIAFDGHIILDRNDGSFQEIGYHIIDPSKFSDKHLLAKLTQKSWFGNSLYEEFKRAYLIGCRLAGVHPIEQEKFF